MNSYFRRFGWNIPDPFVFLVLLNATIASLGAALGGFLSSKTIRRQVRETIVAGVLGLWLYLMWGAMLFVVIVIVRTSIILLFG